MRRARYPSLLCLALTLGIATPRPTLAVPTVWSGLSFTFTNPGGVLPPASDPITSNVALARGLSQGLYNAAKESGWNGSGPLDTQWATDINNPGQVISAANYAALTFDAPNSSWLEAFGGSGQIGHLIVGRDAVLRLVTDDIYLDVKFTSWGQTSLSGGAFEYMRAVAPPPPTTTGDYNGNGRVDAADYVVWRDTVSQIVTAGQGADGDGSSIIDGGDYDYWLARFGNVIPAAAAGTSSIAVPEPTSALLLLSGLLAARRPIRY